MFREYVLAESCELAKSTSDVIFRAFLARVSKNFRGRSELDEFAEIKDTSVIGNAPGLLHVVSDNYDGVLRFQFLNQFFDPSVAIGSSAEHGSSMRITSGSTASARAMQSRCC